MAAPPAGLVTALRNGTVKRHHFFRMTHSQGTVLAWNGVGEFEFESEIYRGVAGLGAITGISDSSDIQNHETMVLLNGVPQAALVGIDPDVRGQTVSIKAAWITVDGQVPYSRTLLRGIADNLSAKFGSSDFMLTLKVRAPLAEWMAPPRSSYTRGDQQRRFPGDTGFDFVKTLENASVSGWSVNEEASGAIPVFATGIYLRDSVDLVLIGNNVGGVSPARNASAPTILTDQHSSSNYSEQGSGAVCTISETSELQVGGVSCYVDVLGDVRTVGGFLVIGIDSERLRLQTAIVGNGTPTATTIVYDDGIGNPQLPPSVEAENMMKKVGTGRLLGSAGGGVTPTQHLARWSAAVYGNRNGKHVRRNASLGAADYLDGGTVYREDVTGTAVSWSGSTPDSSTLQVGGSNCFVSTTGVILTPGGRRIIRTGFPEDFLRVWT